MLAQRTVRLVLVIDAVESLANRHAIFRSAEAFGVQDVWVVSPPKARPPKTVQGVPRPEKSMTQMRAPNRMQRANQAAHAVTVSWPHMGGPVTWPPKGGQSHA